MVCPHCDRRIPDGSEKCEYCGLEIVTEEPQEQPKEKKPSILLGTLGAFLGAVLGCVFLFFACRNASLFGTVAGMGLAFFTIKGYQLLGKKLGRGGIMISMALIAVLVSLVNRLDWAVQIVADQAWPVINGVETELDVYHAFTLVPVLLNMSNAFFSKYMTNLVLCYVFCGVGAFFTIRNILRNQE